MSRDSDQPALITNLSNYLPTDGKWYPVADTTVSTAFSRPSRNTSAGVPPVCLRRAPGKADGTSCSHWWRQGRRQVCKVSIWVKTLESCEGLNRLVALLIVSFSTGMGNLKSCWRRASHWSRCHPSSRLSCRCWNISPRQVFLKLLPYSIF